jgi:hypothetical protein
LVLNGAFVTAFSLAAGCLILGVAPAGRLAPAPLRLVILIAAFSCTGLGLVNAAARLRIPRERRALERHLRRSCSSSRARTCQLGRRCGQDEHGRARGCRSRTRIEAAQASCGCGPASLGGRRAG